MVRAFWWLCLLGLMLGITGTSQAQLRAGDVRLYMDSGFVTFTVDRAKGELGGRDVLEKRKTTEVDLFGAGGLGLSYVVSRHIAPGIYFSLQRTKVKGTRELDDNETSSSTTARQWELRPYLEIPFNPGSRFVVHATAGVTLMRWVTDDPDFDAFGVGPMGGLGAHGFVTSKVSIDLGLMFRAAFVKSDDLEDLHEARGWDDPKFRQLALLFTVGASYWL